MSTEEILSNKLFRYMRPGTRHFVVTVEDCLAVGGHFYNRENFSATMIAIVYEHYYGNSITNTAHPSSPIILFKLLADYADILADDNSADYQKESE